MQTKPRYSLFEYLYWSRFEILFIGIYVILSVVLYKTLHLNFLQIPWTPIALIGTAVAFLIGFQTNSAYGRIWEARQIWGGIVNTSRTFAMMTKDLITNEYTDSPLEENELKHLQKTILNRHFAWLTALRYAMRQPKKWEVFYQYKSNRDFAKKMYVPEREENFENALRPYLSKDEFEYVMLKGNKPTTLLFLQSQHLKQLKERGLIWEFSFLEFENALEELFTHQGKSERIKNFPYPKQYSSLSVYIVWIFIFLLPFGLIEQFESLSLELSKTYTWGKYYIWSLVPFSIVVSWVFWILQRVSMVGDNPFEGSGNDVPISAIARSIEIDLRQQFDEATDEIPSPFPEKNNIQM